ncbi:hypothetical protein RJ640_028726 [Escallonia rubra]|uniref:Uncharacterized protein n=1 Tax=Escallonia rubra TaxID=112253 RepID=A0AA88UF47_9ASTE|nr:hypothetical protein RJ640_028726 [Escallonia rubra]
MGMIVVAFVMMMELGLFVPQFVFVVGVESVCHDGVGVGVCLRGDLMMMMVVELVFVVEDSGRTGVRYGTSCSCYLLTFFLCSGPLIIHDSFNHGYDMYIITKSKILQRMMVAVSKSYIWAYASFQFAIVILFAHIFYAVLNVSSILSVLLSSFTGFGIAISTNSLLVEYLRWRTSRDLQSSHQHVSGGVQSQQLQQHDRQYHHHHRHHHNHHHHRPQYYQQHLRQQELQQQQQQQQQQSIEIASVMPTNDTRPQSY